MKITFRHAVGIAAAACALAGMAACFPDELNSATDLDTVTTLYDKQKNFENVTTYALIDTVVFLDADGPGGDTESSAVHAYDDEIVAAMKHNLDALGWQQVNPATTAPDVTAQAMTTSKMTVGYYYDWWYYWGWYPYWPPMYGPGWGPGYPPVSVSYAYTTGTVMMSILDTKRADPEANKVPIVWVGAANGVVTGTGGASRVTDAINQAFTQSPYLKGVH